MNQYSQSDLAKEGIEHLQTEIAGVSQSVRNLGGFTVTKLSIGTESASKELGYSVGNYVTWECGNIRMLSEERFRMLCHILAGELRGVARRLSGRVPDSDFCVLVAGLGNAELTADAIGPATVGKLTATRHLRLQEEAFYREMGCSSLAAFAPGVLGQTGMETVELLKGAVKAAKPDLLLVVDALAARSCDRLASVIQLTDCGVRPGSGVGNRRDAVTKETVGVPVACLGVPTVVNSSTLVYDALNQAGIEQVSPELEAVLENGKSFFVTPKESDLITDSVSSLLADSLKLAFTEHF